MQELRTLKARYCRLLGAGAWRELDPLFAPNGQVRVYDVDGHLTYFADAPDVGLTLSRRLGGAQVVVHAFSAELTIVSPTRADGVWAMEDHLIYPATGSDLGRRAHGFGHFHETYVRHDGRWLIRSLELTRIRVDRS
ncbi:UNVERIFIED_CONTAM: hypothetical protein LK11_18195 [Mumia flava]